MKYYEVKQTCQNCGAVWRTYISSEQHEKMIECVCKSVVFEKEYIETEFSKNATKRNSP